MKPIRTLLLLLLCCCCQLLVPAAEAIALWDNGSGTIADQPAEHGLAIAASAIIRVAEGGPGRLKLASGGILTLAPGSAISLRHEGNQQLCELLSGSIQCDLPALAADTHFTVRGGSSDTTVVGTLFVVARRTRHQDRIAVMRGTVQVKLKREVLAALGIREETIELGERQALEADAQGLGRVTRLEERPQLVRGDTANAADPWNYDAAAAILGDSDLVQALADQQTTALAEQAENLAVGGEAAGEELQRSLGDQLEEVEAASTAVTGELSEEQLEEVEMASTAVSDDLAEEQLDEIESAAEIVATSELVEEIQSEISDELANDLTIQEEIIEEVVQQTAAAVLDDFPAPPNP